MRFADTEFCYNIEAEFEMNLDREDDSTIRIQVLGNYTRQYAQTEWTPAEGGQFEIQAVYTVPGADEIMDALSPAEKEAILNEANDHYPEEE